MSSVLKFDSFPPLVDAPESTYSHKIVQIKYIILFKLKKLLKIKKPWTLESRSLERKSLTERDL
jgi:hypothetical protein